MRFDVAKELKNILDDYSVEVYEKASKIIEKEAKKSTKKIKVISPKRYKNYSKGWGMTIERGSVGVISAVIHNKTDYRLTHLLENGHFIVRKTKIRGVPVQRIYGRTRRIPHISIVQEELNQNFAKELINEIEK